MRSWIAESIKFFPDFAQASWYSLSMISHSGTDMCACTIRKIMMVDFGVVCWLHDCQLEHCVYAYISSNVY